MTFKRVSDQNKVYENIVFPNSTLKYMLYSSYDKTTINWILIYLYFI